MRSIFKLISKPLIYFGIGIVFSIFVGSLLNSETFVLSFGPAILILVGYIYFHECKKKTVSIKDAFYGSLVLSTIIGIVTISPAVLIMSLHTSVYNPFSLRFLEVFWHFYRFALPISVVAALIYTLIYKLLYARFTNPLVEQLEESVK